MVKNEQRKPESTEPYKPMAAPEPTEKERLEALEIQCRLMKEWINAHNRSHYRTDAL